MTTAAAPPLEQIHLALRSNPHVCAREVLCREQEGRIVLTGVVRSYYEKQMAQETVRRLDGVHEIRNLLEVSWN